MEHKGYFGGAHERTKALRRQNQKNWEKLAREITSIGAVREVSLVALTRKESQKPE